jgi:Recombination endonuclease VII
MQKHLIEKFCPKCEKTLPIAHFYFNARLSRYDSWCKDCQRIANRVRRRTTYTPEVGRAENYRRYGLTLQQFEEMLVAQGGVCAVCGRPETVINPYTKKIQQLHIDHCHLTGRVRGLLCQECNTAYGMLEEDPERIRLLLAYAEKHKAYVPLTEME